jgi:two-component system nitrate/nitrite response regulator NarL
VAAARRPAPPFSPREASILQLLREGAPNKLIARQLSLTEATVKVHLKSILRKIRVNNRTQAAVWAMQQDALLAAAQVNGQSK